MLNRILVAVGLLAIVALATLFRTYGIPALLIILGILSYYETYKAFKHIGMAPNLWSGITMIIGMVPMAVFFADEGILGLYMLLTLVTLIWSIFYPNRKYTDIIVSVFLMFYPTYGYMALMQIHIMQPDALATVGILLAALVPSMGDAGALFAGKLFGRHKLASELSPKKTVEGSIGGFVISVLTALLIGLVVERTGFFTDFRLWQYLLIGIVVGVAAQVGDLTASALKRYTGIKDFGTIFLSHGGVMDRMDSVLMGAVALLVLLKAMT